MDEVGEECVAVVVVGKQPVSDATPCFTADGLADPAVEALDHAIGLGMEGLGEAVLDSGLCAHPVEGMITGGFVLGLAGHVDSEAVGELGSVVGEDSVHVSGEMRQEAFEKGGGGGGIAGGWISR
jgi:hypothetical protein